MKKTLKSRTFQGFLFLKKKEKEKGYLIQKVNQPIFIYIEKEQWSKTKLETLNIELTEDEANFISEIFA